MRFISVNCFYFVYFASAVSILTSLLTFFIPESPRFLYGGNQLEECAKVLKKIAKYNGVIGYDDPKFDAEYEILVEGQEGNPASRVSDNQQRLSDGQFDHLLGRQTQARDGTKATEKAQNGRYITQARATQRMTKRESVAYMHATVTGLRQTAHLFLIGVDKTNSIALDEAFTQKPVIEG